MEPSFKPYYKWITFNTIIETTGGYTVCGHMF